MFFILVFIILCFTSVLYFVNRSVGLCKCSKHLVGKVVIITGASTGIGYDVAKDLAFRGAKVILTTKDIKGGEEARDNIINITGNQDVHFKFIDLSVLSSVREFAEEILKTEKQLDVLINNAGTSSRSHKLTKDGLLVDMQVNYFGHFLLTSLLLPLLKTSAPSRIINVSSVLHSSAELDLNDLNMLKYKKVYKSQLVYNNSKLCMLLMSVELSRRLEGTGVTVNALHPGTVLTNLVSHNAVMKIGIVRFLFKIFTKDAWEGAQTAIYLSAAPEVKNISGKYFVDCKAKSISGVTQDRQLSQKLWEISEKLVNLN